VTALAWLAGRQWLASGGVDATVVIWDLRAGQARVGFVFVVLCNRTYTWTLANFKFATHINTVVRATAAALTRG
jgi:hypothetical protein